jgi:hypothetical protein
MLATQHAFFNHLHDRILKYFWVHAQSDRPNTFRDSDMYQLLGTYYTLSMTAGQALNIRDAEEWVHDLLMYQNNIIL